jgi:hypothetical protein
MRDILKRSLWGLGLGGALSLVAGCTAPTTGTDDGTGAAGGKADNGRQTAEQVQVKYPDGSPVLEFRGVVRDQLMDLMAASDRTTTTIQSGCPGDRCGFTERDVQVNYPDRGKTHIELTGTLYDHLRAELASAASQQGSSVDRIQSGGRCDSGGHGCGWSPLPGDLIGKDAYHLEDDSGNVIECADLEFYQRDSQQRCTIDVEQASALNTDPNAEAMLEFSGGATHLLASVVGDDARYAFPSENKGVLKSSSGSTEGFTHPVQQTKTYRVSGEAGDLECISYMMNSGSRGLCTVDVAEASGVNFDPSAETIVEFQGGATSVLSSMLNPTEQFPYEGTVFGFRSADQGAIKPFSKISFNANRDSYGTEHMSVDGNRVMLKGPLAQHVVELAVAYRNDNPDQDDYEIELFRAGGDQQATVKSISNDRLNCEITGDAAQCELRTSGSTDVTEGPFPLQFRGKAAQDLQYMMSAAARTGAATARRAGANDTAFYQTAVFDCVSIGAATAVQDQFFTTYNVSPNESADVCRIRMHDDRIEQAIEYAPADHSNTQYEVKPEDIRIGETESGKVAHISGDVATRLFHLIDSLRPGFKQVDFWTLNESGQIVRYVSGSYYGSIAATCTQRGMGEEAARKCTLPLGRQFQVNLPGTENFEPTRGYYLKTTNSHGADFVRKMTWSVHHISPKGGVTDPVLNTTQGIESNFSQSTGRVLNGPVFKTYRTDASGGYNVIEIRMTQ